MTAAVLRKKSSCFFLPENRTPGTDDRQGRNGFADQGSGERRENEESREYRDNEERIEMKREWRECTGGKYRGKDRKGRRSNTEDGRRGNRKERKHREQEDRGEKEPESRPEKTAGEWGRERGFCHAFETTKPYCVKKTEKT